MSKVQSMHKVRLEIQLTTAMAYDNPGEPVTLSFIYGIGRDGLSPFESCLEGRSPGEHIEFAVKGNDVAASFGALFSLIRGLLDGMIRPEVLKFAIDILGVEKADNSEVVSALASSVGGCGSGGSCGCGC